ncbi:MAG: helix-turn-helix domain-containing protein [Desulfomonile tiedjei]|nr:helix-turn-helix domain-containing protein [Desulfomonile tiedjei]
MLERLLTPEDVAAHFHVKRKTVLDWTRQGRLPYSRIADKVIRFTEEDLRAFAEGKKHGTPKTVDRKPATRIPSPPRRKEVESTEGSSVRALREEMRSW